MQEQWSSVEDTFLRQFNQAMDKIATNDISWQGVRTLEGRCRVESTDCHSPGISTHEHAFYRSWRSLRIEYAWIWVVPKTQAMPPWQRPWIPSTGFPILEPKRNPGATPQAFGTVVSVHRSMDMEMHRESDGPVWPDWNGYDFAIPMLVAISVAWLLVVSGMPKKKAKQASFLNCLIT